MKRFAKHKKTVIIILAATAYMVFLLLVPTLIKLPGAISYTASTQRNVSDKTPHENTAMPVCKSVREIEHNGPFHIKALDGNVYVFHEDSCLYKIKTSASQFSEQDNKSILEGLEISDKTVLIEIVEYLES